MISGLIRPHLGQLQRSARRTIRVQVSFTGRGSFLRLRFRRVRAGWLGIGRAGPGGRRLVGADAVGVGLDALDEPGKPARHVVLKPGFGAVGVAGDRGQGHQGGYDHVA